MCYTLRNQEDSIPFPLPPESPQMSHADAAIPKYQGFVIHVAEHAARIQHVEKPMAESYAAIVVPVTNADKTVDVVDKSFKPLSDADQVAFEAYDAEMYNGAHVSVQLVGRRLQEEKMLVLAEYLSGLLKN
jgi:hypothetical protein